MSTEKKYRKTGLFLLAGSLTALLFLTGAVGSTTAHYESAVCKEQTLEYDNSSGGVYILNREKEEDKSFAFDEKGQFTFLLANGSDPNSGSVTTQEAALAVFATLGVGDPENVSILLTDGGSSYQARPMEIEKGTAWYRAYGAGWIYRFYNESGEELCWTLKGGQFAYREMTLTVSGAAEAPAALSVIAAAQPVF